MILNRENVSLVKQGVKSSRDLIMRQLVKDGHFSFAGYIQNEVRATTLVLFKMTAKWIGLPFDEATAITKSFAEKLAEDIYTGWLKSACDSLDIPYQDNWEIMERYMPFCYRWKNVPYNHSTAASGVIMLNGETALPVRDDTVTYNGVDLEAEGYIKYDILTVSTLDMIQSFYGLNYDWNDTEHDGKSLMYKNADGIYANLRFGVEVALADGRKIYPDELHDKIQHGEEIHLANGEILTHENTFLLENSKVWDTISSGDTDFVFQFASPGMKQLVTEGHAVDIEALSECVALWRPGPIEAKLIPLYLDIRQGKHPDLTAEQRVISSILKGVYGEKNTGLLIYQENVMKLAQECCNFSLTDADSLRRAMGKKKEKVMAEWKDRFIDQWTIPYILNIENFGSHLPKDVLTTSNGIKLTVEEMVKLLENGEEVCLQGLNSPVKLVNVYKETVDPEQVWEALKGFAHYAFNKAHSVGYAIVAYATAKLWTYHRNDVLEYLLNEGTKENQNNALAKCRELGFEMKWADLEHLNSNRYVIQDNGDGRCALYMPIEIDEGKHWNSYAEFITECDVNIGNLIASGLCDRLTNDRYALLELCGSMLTKPKRLAANMEPEGVKFNTLSEILDGLKLAGAVTKWARANGGYDVYVTRANGKPPTFVHFRPDWDEQVRMERMKYDMKMFGAVRSGILSNRPEVEHHHIESQIEHIKERLHAQGRDGEAYKACKRQLMDHMREYHSIPAKRTFVDVYCMVEDIKAYSKSVKLFLLFNNCNDIFYAGKEFYDMAFSLKKNTMIKLSLEYSPYIKAKNCTFIYDFDITRLEVIK